jgi:O-antigen ligase
MIFAALLILIVATPIPYGTVQPWWNATFELTVFALAILWLIDCLLSRRFLTSQHLWLVAPLAALTLYAFIQTIPFTTQASPIGPLPQAISADRFETKLFAIRVIALALAFAMLLQYTNTRNRMVALAYAVIAIALASAVFGMIRQLYQSHPKGFLLASLPMNAGYGQFINKNHFAYLAEMALGLLLGLIAGRAVSRSRSLVYIAIALPIWTALVLSNSRGGILAMISQVIFLLLIMNIGWKRATKFAAISPAQRIGSLALKLVLGVALVFGIVVGMIWIGGEPLANRLSSVRGEISSQPADTSRVDRRSIWAATLRMWRDHPLAGAGLGGYWIAITRYHDGSGEMVPQQAHNDYLELAASGGIVGVAFMIWFLIIASRQAMEQLRARDQMRRALALGALTGLFAVAVHSLFDFGLHLTGNTLIAISLLTIATRRLNSENTERPNG